MQVSRHDEGGDAIMILSTDRRVDAATLDRLRSQAGISGVKSIEV
jgi:hypothetical protein